MMMKPLVGVLIPLYNARPWVARAIDSALAQTWNAKEIIVVDDGSTDGSAEVVARYRGHIRIETQPRAGQNATRNRLTALTRAEWLVYLDADDELAHDCIAAKVACTGDADVIYGSMETATFDGDAKMSSRVRRAAPCRDPWVTAFEWQYPNTSGFMFRRSALVRAGLWNESVRVCTDYDLHFRLLVSGAKFQSAPDSMSMYRHWSRSQAVHVDPVARVRARIRLMRQAAERLVASGEMTGDRRRAFEQSALRCVRSLHHFDRSLARRELQELAQWNSHVAPLSPEFSRVYRLAFRVGGLDAAEGLARWSRPWRTGRPEQTRSLDFDATMTAGTVVADH